jgi:hypothetical protein
MNAEMKVLQALDAAQQALRQMQGNEATGHRDRLAHSALQALSTAPWSMVTRTGEAAQHGWLTELRDALQHIEEDPEGPQTADAIDEALWASLELERDLRQMVGAK